MKYAEIIYGNVKDRSIYNWFNSSFRPYSTEDISAFGAEGYKILINLPKGAEEKFQKRVFDKVRVFLEQNNVGTQTGINLGCIHYADGSVVGLLSYAEKLRFDFETIIIEGEKYLTELAICIVLPRVKYVSLLCNDKNEYNKVWDYYFYEYGINIQFISSFKHENFKNADAVIDCKNIRRKSGLLAQKENALYAADEKIRFLSDKNIGIEKREELIKNMDLSALTRN